MCEREREREREMGGWKSGGEVVTGVHTDSYSNSQEIFSE